MHTSTKPKPNTIIAIIIPAGMFDWANTIAPINSAIKLPNRTTMIY